MLKIIGMFLIVFGGIGLIQNLRFLLAFRKITKVSSAEQSEKAAVNEHFAGLFVFSIGIFALGIYLVQR